MILATAVVRKAEVLYTNDGALANIARERLEVRGLPPSRPKQTQLPI